MFKTAFSAVLILVFVLPAIGKEPVSWSIEGVMADACQCNVFCPCEFQSLPTFGHCDDTAVLNIAKGHFGNVNLDGTKIAATGRSPEGKRMSESAGNLTFSRIYISKDVSEEQARALSELARVLFGKKVGETYRISADEKLKQVDMNVLIDEPYHYHIKIPNILNMEILAPPGGDGKTPLILRNSPFATLSDIRIGRSKVYQFTSGDIEWDYSGRSASIRSFRVDSEHVRHPENKLQILDPQSEHNHD